MRIVHYTLGLYPERTGGLNRYATDLIKEQSKNNDVCVIMPGRWKPWQKYCSISKVNIINGIKCYGLVNALPQPLLMGIKNPKDFIDKPISESSFESFFENARPEVLHLHTFMGLPKSALLFFKEKGVHIVYTSHDYFGICPRVNLIKVNGNLCEGSCYSDCTMCNLHAPSTIYLRMRSSKLAFKTRDVVRWIESLIHF